MHTKLQHAEEEEQLRKAVSSDGRVVDIMDAKLGSVIGCHVGPKVIGLVCIHALENLMAVKTIWTATRKAAVFSLHLINSLFRMLSL